MNMNREFLEIYSEGIRVFSETSFNDWIHTHCNELGDVPFNMIFNEEGRKKVITFLREAINEKIQSW